MIFNDIQWYLMDAIFYDAIVQQSSSSFSWNSCDFGRPNPAKLLSILTLLPICEVDKIW